MKLRIRSAPEGPVPAAALASIGAVVGLFLLQALAHETDRTALSLPSSVSRTEADRGAACVVLARGAGPEGATNFAFTDGEGPSRPLGGVTDVFLAALRVVAEEPSRPLAIKADEGVRYGLVDDVIEQLRKAGVRRLTLLTAPRAAGEAR
jgi:hypothetical protein